MPRALPRITQPRGADDRNEVADGVLQYVIQYNVVELRHMAHLAARAQQAPGDHVLAVGAAPAQALLQHIERGRQHEHPHGLRKRLAHLLRALPVDLQQDVVARADALADPGPGRAVVVTVDLGPLEKFTGIAHRPEAFDVDEMVVLPVHLALARRAGGVGDGQLHARVARQQTMHQRGLAGPRGGRDDDQGSGHGGLRHSMFWTCSRICSISTFISMAMALTSPATDLEARVLASRLSSCIRKSRRLPAWPPAARMRSTSSRWATRRLSSSSTSTRWAKTATSWRMRSSSSVATASRRRLVRRSW